MSFLFKYYSLVKVMYLLISCCKTRFFLWSTNNTNRNGVNIRNKHIHTRIHQTLRERKHWKGLVSMKLSDTPPWKKNNNNSTYITNPSIFMGKIWTETDWTEPSNFGSCSIEKSFLPSCFEIRCEGFLWIHQRNWKDGKNFPYNI